MIRWIRAISGPSSEMAGGSDLFVVFTVSP